MDLQEKAPARSAGPEKLLQPAAVLLMLGRLAYRPPPFTDPSNIERSRIGFCALLGAAALNGFDQATALIELLEAGISNEETFQLCQAASDAAGPHGLSGALTQMRLITLEKRRE